MAEKSRIGQIVEQAVSQVLERHLPQLRDELVHEVLSELKPQLASSAGANGSASDLLNAISGIHAGATQKEILRALLDSTDHYCGRAALFVIKGAAATGWQGRAFDNSDEIKDFSLDVNSTAPAKVLQSRSAVSAKVSEMDPKFVSQFGAPADDPVLLLPLRLKDKLAALVYADGGTEAGAKLDPAALELLVTATSAWLEVASLRKQAVKDGPGTEGGDRIEAAAVQTVSSFSDPFAGHAPRHAMAAPAEPVAQPVMAEGGAAAAAARAPDAFAQMSPADAEIHRKAQRFARLLMDEIKLYNQAKVAEGRKNKDLYDRLKDDIEKSRATYNKRYGNTTAASADYFNSELIRSLAEDDVSLLGSNFRR